MRTVPVVGREELERMHTGSLLARLRRLHRCEESLELPDMDPWEPAATSEIVFKDSPAWRAAYEDVKAVLAGREHVPGSVERAEARREAARVVRSGERSRRR